MVLLFALHRFRTFYGIYYSAILAGKCFLVFRDNELRLPFLVIILVSLGVGTVCSFCSCILSLGMLSETDLTGQL